MISFNKYILSIGSHAKLNSINLKIGYGGEIDIILCKNNGVDILLDNTNNLVLIDEWNFVGLSWEYMCVDNGPEVFNMTINLNGINTNFMTSDGDICYFNSSSPLAVIGGASDANRNRHSDSFNGLFTSVIAVPNKVLADWEFNEYYRQTKALMFTTDNFDGIISVNAINNYNFGNIILEKK